MNKKIFLSILITLTICLFNINSVKATEGEGNNGTDSVICKYCKGSDCYYIAQNKKAPQITSSNSENEVKKNENRQRIFSSSAVEIELMWSEGWLETDEQWTLPYIENPSLCTNHMYKVRYTQLFAPFANPLSMENKKTTDAFIAINGTETATSITKYIEPFVVFSTGETHDETVEKFDEYNLVYQYGTDYGIKDARTVQLIKNMLKDTSSNIDNSDKKGYADNMGCAILTGPILEKLNWFFDIIKYGGAALAILLGALDFFKAVMSDEDKSTSKAAGRFIKRLIAAALIFLLPLIIQFVLNNVKIDGFNHNAPTCGVGVSDK